MLSAVVQYCPYRLAGGWAQQRERFVNVLIDAIAQHAPGLRAMVLASELLTPEDLEREFRATGGHWHHADLALDQFFMVRPVPGAAQYATPVAGFYVCGAGCHPGGGVMGLAGRNAARQVLVRGRVIMSHQSNLPPHFQQPLLPTPFHERARLFSQVDSFVPWAGYSTVDVFTNMEQEYFAIRNATTLYDLTPMVKYRIAGTDAARFLNRLVTRDISRLKINRVSYCIWCNDDGHIIDDGTVFRLGENEYRLCTAEWQLDWLLGSAIGFDVQIDEVTADIAALALQGPTSCAVLKNMGLAGIEQLKPFEIGIFETAGIELTVSRTGFTGDLGYELWVDPAQAGALWDALMAAGRSRGIRPIGSRALNMARIEAGFLSPKVDFVSAESSVRVGTDRSPLELGLAWLIDFDKGHFTGRRALLAQKRAGLATDAGRARYSREQTGEQRAALRGPKGSKGNRQHQFSHLVANLQTQYCTWYGRGAAL